MPRYPVSVGSCFFDAFLGFLKILQAVVTQRDSPEALPIVVFAGNTAHVFWRFGLLVEQT